MGITHELPYTEPGVSRILTLEDEITETFMEALWRPPTPIELGIITTKFDRFGAETFLYSDNTLKVGAAIIMSSITGDFTFLGNATWLTITNMLRIRESIRVVFNFAEILTEGIVSDELIQQLTFILLSLTYDHDLKQIVLNMDDIYLIL